jgi:hypothetical protein
VRAAWQAAFREAEAEQANWEAYQPLRAAEREERPPRWQAEAEPEAGQAMNHQPGPGPASKETTDRQPAGKAGRAQDHERAPEPAAVSWTRTRLREQIQRRGTALAPISETADSQTHQAQRSPLADREAETVTTTSRNITADMTPVEAANLMAKLDEGQQAAWLATHEVPWQSAEYQSRFHNAAQVDDVFRDLMQETVDNGMRRPGEPVEEFTERAESEARLAEARKAHAKTAPGPITQQADAGITPERAGESQDGIATRLLNDLSTPEGLAYAGAFSDTAATYVRQLRQRDPLPEPDRTPGAPHPDPCLTSRGWHMNKHGIYTRRAEPEPPAEAEREVEAGS